MNRRTVATVTAIAGAVYLVTIAWMCSWWYVPALLGLGPRAFTERTPYGGTAFFVIWASSGVLGGILVALGAALYCAVGRFRLLLLASGGTVLVAWLVFWTTTSHNAVVFGAGGGLILLCFLTSCLDWAGTRRHLSGLLRTAADLRLAANVSFFIAAWGLCGLLGGPLFALRSEFSAMRGTESARWGLAIKVLACLVLGWGFTAVAQRIERRERSLPLGGDSDESPMESRESAFRRVRSSEPMITSGGI